MIGILGVKGVTNTKENRYFLRVLPTLFSPGKVDRKRLLSLWVKGAKGSRKLLSPRDDMRASTPPLLPAFTGIECITAGKKLTGI